MNEQQLLDRRARNWEAMQAMTRTAAEEHRDLTPEELQRWDALEKDVAADTDRIKQKRSQTRLEAEFDDVTTGPGIAARVSDDDASETDTEERAYTDAWVAWARGGMGALEPEQRQRLQQRFSTAQGVEYRAQGVGTTTAGGYAVAPEFRERIVERMKAYGRVRDVAEVFTTETGAQIQWPTNDDTANIGAILSENTQVTEQDFVLGQTLLDTYMYTSKLVRVSYQLLQDSAFDLPGFIARKFAERLGRATNAHYTTGTGTAQPQGLVTGGTVGKTGATGQTLTVIYNDLVDLVHSVDPAYRDAGQARWMMGDTITATVRKLRDDSGGAGLGRPLWEPSVQAGVPDSLMGYPITYNNDMPVPAANAKTIAFGDLNAGYVIRDVLDIQSLRLEERYADFLQVGFLAFLRTGGIVQDANAYKLYAHSAT